MYFILSISTVAIQPLLVFLWPSFIAPGPTIETSVISGDPARSEAALSINLVRILETSTILGKFEVNDPLIEQRILVEYSIFVGGYPHKSI